MDMILTPTTGRGQKPNPHFMVEPHRIHKRPSLARILSYINPLHVFPPHFLETNFSTVVPSIPRSSKLSPYLGSLHQNFMHLSCFPYVPHAPTVSFSSI